MDALKVYEKKKNRVLYYDILNILSCFCVIWLHSNGLVHNYSVGRYWATSLIVETIAYWAVPVFMMLSGATLMDYRKKYDTKTFFKKRVIKTGIPFIIWSVLILIWDNYSGRVLIQDKSIKHLCNMIILNQEETTYYFFWAIFSVYLSMPVLSLLTESKNRNILWYIVVVSAIFGSLPQLLRLIGIEWNNELIFPVAGGYIMFVVLGYLISTQNIKKFHRIIIYLLGIFAILIRYFTTYFLSMRDGYVNRSFWGYTFFTGLFLALAVFVFVKHLNLSKIEENDKIVKVVQKISSCSFGIYLIHRIVMFYELKFLDISESSWQWRVLGAISTYIIGLSIVYIMKKIPIIKKIVP